MAMLKCSVEDTLEAMVRNNVQVLLLSQKQAEQRDSTRSLPRHTAFLCHAHTSVTVHI